MDHTYFYSLFAMVTVFTVISACIWYNNRDET